eukprot:m.436223 g.436223  ORF g.436223 m.436223 type:complete len:63 (+) comp17951_c0_seq1:101-289(+)
MPYSVPVARGNQLVFRMGMVHLQKTEREQQPLIDVPKTTTSTSTTQRGTPAQGVTRCMQLPT